MLCLQAQSVDTDKKTVTFDDGSVQRYDQLLISTGCRYTQTHTARGFLEHQAVCSHSDIRRVQTLKISENDKTKKLKNLVKSLD